MAEEGIGNPPQRGIVKGEMKLTAETQRTQSIAEEEKGGGIKPYPSLCSLCDLRDSAVREFDSAHRRDAEGAENE